MSLDPVGVFGGTYNPIHYGHLRSALELREQLQLAEVRMMPAANPPHRRSPACPAELRAAMVSLAVAEEAGLVCDRRELGREGPSYSIDSLRELRTELGADRSLCLIVGTDAIAELDGWHRWRELIDYAHLVVIARPGWHMPEAGAVAAWLQEHLTAEVAILQHRPQGAVLLQKLRPLAISATEIRAMIAAGRSPRYLIPDPVWQYIQDAGLYGLNGDKQE